MNATEVRVKTSDLSEQDIEILSGLFMHAGFSGIHQEEGMLHAYFPDRSLPFLPEELARTAGISFRYSIHPVMEKNWNECWERSFKPVIIDNKVGIRASFHPHSGCSYDLVIDPRMAFGTGHHPTTLLMIRSLLHLEPAGLDVLDMGTGTGILAMLAEKLGASLVYALDHSEAAVEASRENIRVNQCVRIRTFLMEQPPAGKSFHLILANINRNTLIRHMQAYHAALRPGGKLILSGFYMEDEERIKQKARQSGLIFESYTREDEWSVGFFCSDKPL